MWIYVGRQEKKKLDLAPSNYNLFSSMGHSQNGQNSGS